MDLVPYPMHWTWYTTQFVEPGTIPVALGLVPYPVHMHLVPYPVRLYLEPTLHTLHAALEYTGIQAMHCRAAALLHQLPNQIDLIFL